VQSNAALSELKSVSSREMQVKKNALYFLMQRFEEAMILFGLADREFRAYPQIINQYKRTLVVIASRKVILFIYYLPVYQK